MPESAKDLKFSAENLKCYVLGKYGTGKSVFGSSFPTPGYVFDFDQRIKTYRGLDWDYDTYPLTGMGWVQFEKNIKQVAKAVKEGKYKTVILDSTTSFTDCAMARALQIDPKRSPENGPIWNVHFNIVKNIVDPKLKQILSFDCNIVFMGHWNIVTDMATGDIISIDPLLTGQLSEKVPGYFDEVYAAGSQMNQGKDHYYIRTTTFGHYRSRSTISGKLQLLPTKIPNDYPSVMAYANKAQELEDIHREKGVTAFNKAKKNAFKEIAKP
ncbi:MAG: AAA family ATPase [Candidatus Peribacteraceae bacterium]|nr:AAA family ATPase [Candidatus Peribacteraceae bacterium]